MDILFLSHYFPPEGNAPATRTHALCKRWAAAGHRVFVVTCAPNVPSGVVYRGYKNRWRQVETIDGIRVVRVWTYLAPNRGIERRICNFLSFMATGVAAGLSIGAPDVVISTSPQFFCGWAGAIVAKLRRRPFILDLRDLWPSSIEAVGAIKHRHLLQFLDWLERRLYASGNHIVTVGAGYRNRVLEKGVKFDKVSVINNGVDCNFFSPGDAPLDLRREYGLDGKSICTWVGTVGMSSGLDVLLGAARLLRARARADVAFLVVGDGAILQDLQRKAREERLSNVVFAGLQPKERVLSFLRLSDICLMHVIKHPHFDTVIPYKIYETMAVGRPMVVGFPGMTEQMVRQIGAGVCFEPGDAEELIRSLDSLLANPEAAQAMGERGRHYVLQHFDYDMLARQYATLLAKHAVT